ncbi:MAG TPA: CHAD domain-containing protein [Rubrobacteraceae bacterium]|nr:CHAD domain-containing protein [Rubrobacteraceae bacterium]
MRERVSDHHEVEWQFDALDVRPVARWLESRSHWDGPAVAANETRDLTDTYFDTGDWRLYRAGYALRVRQKTGAGGGFEATMKSLDAGEDGVRRRREISEPVSGAGADDLLAAPGPVGVRLRALAGSVSLAPLFSIKTRRAAYAISLYGEGVGEVVLDTSEIPLEDGAEPVMLRRVEVEMQPETEPEAVDGVRESLESFVGELREGCRLSPARASKYEAAVFAHNLTPPGALDLGSTAVDESLTVGQVAFAVMREQFVEFLAHEPGTRIGEDPEELHDMRVASRRLRAAVKVFDEALPVRLRGMEAEVKWIATALGEVRDLDVQLEQLEEWLAGAEPEDREPLGELRGVLEDRHEKARRAMIRALDSRRYARLVESLELLLRRGPSPRSKAAGRPVLAVAPDLVRKRYRKVRKAGDRISEESSAADYHDLRKKGKRLRYALEFLSGVYGDAAGDLVSPLKKLQDVLGDHQDAEVAIDHLRELSDARAGRRRLSPRTVFVMGGIAHRYALQKAELRAQFPKTYKGIKGKPWKKLRTVMDNLRPSEDEKTS